MGVHLVLLRARKLQKNWIKQFGIKIDKRHIQLDHPIRAIGLIEVPVKIYQDVTGLIQLSIKEA